MNGPDDLTLSSISRHGLSDAVSDRHRRTSLTVDVAEDLHRQTSVSLRRRSARVEAYRWSTMSETEWLVSDHHYYVKLKTYLMT